MMFRRETAASIRAAGRGQGSSGNSCATLHVIPREKRAIQEPLDLD
jgi:hypothetical protein